MEAVCWLFLIFVERPYPQLPEARTAEAVFRIAVKEVKKIDAELDALGIPYACGNWSPVLSRHYYGSWMAQQHALRRERAYLIALAWYRVWDVTYYDTRPVEWETQQRNAEALLLLVGERCFWSGEMPLP